MPGTFDIVYAPITMAPPTTVHVLRRGVEGVDRTHALLWWLRDEIGLRVDPVEMFDDLYDHEMECGCEFDVRFRMEEPLGRFERLRNSEPAGPRADFMSTPCETHEQDYRGRPESELRDWQGQITAVAHDPKRKDVYEAAR